MQTVSSDFTTRTSANVRPLGFSVLISFEKDYDAAIDFFDIGTSTIGGTDILKGSGSVLQEWDKYNYEDFTDRVLSIEYDRQMEPPTNPITLATCDFVLDNHDDIFTPGNTSSDLDGFILPRRPVRVSIGFGGELIPIFIGVTDSRPIIDERSKTATFHCIDFLHSLMKVSLDEETIFVDELTSDIISALLETAGLDPTQFDLDDGGVIIPFAYFQKGSKLIDAIHEVAEAELGNISLSEAGVPTFENRTNWASHANVWTFDKSSVIERKGSTTDRIINVVEVKSKARAVQENQKIFQSDGGAIFPADESFIRAGDTVSAWIDFKDDHGALPVSAVDDPAYIDSATTSFYQTNQYADGTGDTFSSDITLDSTDVFSTSMKLTFTNSGTHPVFITQLVLFGTPAKVINDIYVRVEDAASVGVKDGYEEHPITIENNLIQDETAANSIAQIIVSDRSADDDQEVLIVKGVPQLQVGDVITYEDENTDEDYYVTRVNGILNTSGFRQVIHITKRTIESYYRIGISTIGSTTDSLAP